MFKMFKNWDLSLVILHPPHSCTHPLIAKNWNTKYQVHSDEATGLGLSPLASVYQIWGAVYADTAWGLLLFCPCIPCDMFYFLEGNLEGK